MKLDTIGKNIRKVPTCEENYAKKIWLRKQT